VAGYQINMMKIRENERLPQFQKLELKNAFVNQASLKILPNGHTLCAGLTSSRNGGNINGLFFSKYDADWKLIENDTKEFSTMDLIQLSKGDADVNFKKKKDIGLDDNYSLCNVIPYSDGSCLLTLEQNYVTQNTNYYNPYNSSFNGFSRGDVSTTVFYRSNDIITVKVTSNGNIGGINLFPKKQVEEVYFAYQYVRVSEEMSRKASMYLSHTYMLHKDDIYLIYNDHIKNIDDPNIKNQKVINRIKDMESAIVYKDSKEISKTFFFNDQDADLLISPTKTKQISPNSLFFSSIESGGRNRKLRFGIMTFEE